MEKLPKGTTFEKRPEEDEREKSCEFFVVEYFR